MDRGQDIHFVYENGVLRPQEPVNLPEGTRGIAHIKATESAKGSEDSAWMKAQEAAFADAWDDDEDGVYDKM